MSIRRSISKGWALPSGPGFRLRRNHAYGAFPPFGFNPITRGRQRPFREPSPIGTQAIWGFGHSRHYGIMSWHRHPRRDTCRQTGAGRSRIVRVGGTTHCIITQAVSATPFRSAPRREAARSRKAFASRESASCPASEGKGLCSTGMVRRRPHWRGGRVRHRVPEDFHASRPHRVLEWMGLTEDRQC